VASAAAGLLVWAPIAAKADDPLPPSTFNAPAAAQWAAANAMKDPAAWQSPQQDHCAEFVSQALWEAGMPIDKSWYPAVNTSTRKKIEKTIKRNLPWTSGGTPAGSKAWENSFALPDYFVSTKHWAAKTPLDPSDPASASDNGAAAGDLIEYDWQGNNNSRDGHLAMVTKVTSGETDVSQEGVGRVDDQVGRPWSVSLEGSYPDEPLDVLYPHMKAWLIHWNGNDAVSTPSLLPAASQLNPGETLGSGASLTSPNFDYTLVMQPDGNLVEYSPGGLAIWSSGTVGNPGAVLKDQGDGNIVLIAPGNVPIWSTRTVGQPQTALLLQNDGNVVVYAEGNVAVWASGSVQINT
jgi:Putative amidase domain